MTFFFFYSISGTADITNISDKVFIVHRIGKDFEQKASEFLGNAKASELMAYDGVVEVAKDRQFGVVDYFAGMYYEPESRRLKNNIAENIVYGWLESVNEQSIQYEPSRVNEEFEIRDPLMESCLEDEDDLPM